MSLSIVAMHYMRTLHPPGGATALIAAIGGSGAQPVGYLFVLSPNGLGALIMLAVALVINNLSANPGATIRVTGGSGALATPGFSAGKETRQSARR